jgi:protein-tyrosine phosphatase
MTMQMIRPGCLFQECTLPDDHEEPCINERIGYVQVPSQLYHEIAPGLYQGGSFAALPVSAGFDAVFSLFGDADAPRDRRVAHRIWHIPDGDCPDEELLLEHSRWVLEKWTTGHKVLVRCFAGLNRSGLVVARTLILAGATPDEAISLIRSKRSKDALCNPVFESYLRSLA